MALTAKMKAFVHAKVQGKSNKEAAIAAGFSEKSAGSKGSQLMQNPEVLTYLDGLLKSGGEGAGHESLPLVQAAKEAEFKALESIEDPLEGLKHIWKNPNADIKHRIEALKAALPYTRGKVGEVGIKQGREDAADGVAKSGKFATADERRKQRENRMVS